MIVSHLSPDQDPQKTLVKTKVTTKGVTKSVTPNPENVTQALKEMSKKDLAILLVEALSNTSETPKAFMEL